jgi:type VI secretion system protein ImpK
VSTDDPFGPQNDAGPTVIRPTPGGRRNPGATTAGVTAAASPPPARAPGAAGWSGSLPGAIADNPLVACATDLLNVAAQLRGSATHPDPQGLRDGLVRRVREFEQCARARGLADPVVLPARYVLCALLDEAVRDTPWGSQSVWAEQGLLIAFHNEAWGGEKFFDALERLKAFPSGNRNLLELMYLCLALGFEGRYRVREGGQEQLERVREDLYQIIRRERGETERELSPRWRGITPRRDPLIQQVPLWVFSGLAGLLLLGLFTAFTFALSRDADPVFLSLSALDVPAEVMPVRTAPAVDLPEPPAPEAAPQPPPAEPAPPAPRPLGLRDLLSSDIAADRLDVVDRPEGETVVIRGDGLFPSARASLRPEVVPVVRRIGDALKQLPGRVLVTGHSDSAPIKTLQFPSNWHLSQARADSVVALLAEVTGQPERFTAEGRAATEPAVPSNPRDARNRRVEVTLIRPAGGSGGVAATAPPAAADPGQ